MLVAELDAFGHEAGALVCKFWTEASVCTVLFLCLQWAILKDTLSKTLLPGSNVPSFSV